MIKRVALYLPRPIFTNGQLYVTISWATSRSGLKILTLNKENEPHGYVRTVVYKEVLHEVLNNHRVCSKNIYCVEKNQIIRIFHILSEL